MKRRIICISAVLILAGVFLINPSSTKKKSSRREKIEIVPQPLLLGLLRGKIHCFF